MEHTSLNGDPTRHYPGCVNVSFAYVEGESLLMALKDIALSSGSACTSASSNHPTSCGRWVTATRAHIRVLGSVLAASRPRMRSIMC